MQEKPGGQLFESIFNHATIGILVTNSSGRIITINKFGLDIFGYTESEIVGKPVEALIPKRFHKGHVHERTSYQDEPTTREMGAGRDLYGTRKDGTEFPVEVSLSPFKSEDETFVFAFVIDITVRKKIEASERNYQKKVSEILTSLRKEKELTDLQSNFISMASHEFKTPLTTILSSAALLKKYTEKEQQSKRVKHIERIESGVKNINRILNDFLTINNVKAANLQVSYSEFDLEEFILTIKEEFKFLSKKNQTLHYSHSGEKMVFLDAELLKNILSNLLTNASKFSDPDTVIEINSHCTTTEISISVKDEGYGISQQDQEHIFHRFFRGENALTIAGTGLGLHIVRNYIELM
ncbi:MAG TPA: PAS domain-containing sensor histidine kinase, partial [Flavobacteriaceae bacterium]|nr:PAS domain-containing sensor histidine kinase [Flavobacteriaceae bacterium]